MASFKNKKNLLQQRGEYARYFDRLRGVDFSSDHNDVEDSRFAYLVNMYRDYQSGQGGAVETIPGFRSIMSFDAPINGIHIADRRVLVHAADRLYEVGHINDNGFVDIYDQYEMVSKPIVNEKTTSFYYQGYLYILGGGAFERVEYDTEGHIDLVNVADIAYLPTTYHSIDPAALKDTNPNDYGEGYEYEQRNLLNEWYRTTYIADGNNTIFQCKGKIDGSDYEIPYPSKIDYTVTYPSNIEVYQYGVKLPFACGYTDEQGNERYEIPQRFPNAIKKIETGGKDGIAKITLAAIPPRPEHNTWNPNKGDFDYTSNEIEEGVPEKNSYKWPFAYNPKYDGIEIIIKNKINAVGNAIITGGSQASIICNCRIAALYDNHVFLAGNPDFPRYIFYNAIRSDDPTGTPDATFFGQLNFEVEGSSSAPIVAMMNVGDSLLVLKEDSNEDDSVIVHTAKLQSNNIVPKIYPSQKGHRGLGCLGPAYVFQDDPIFLSRFGVDALGHVSTKYRRAIKHRSSMIDAKLLNCYLPPLNEDEEPRKCDLKDASIAEWNGYLMILVAGKIFMADSRQMYNTPNGNTEYEWYYLEDIGVYNGQFDEYVYAEFPTDQTDEQRLEKTGGVEIIEARNVYTDNDTFEHLIGSCANSNGEEIKSVETEYGITYYRELPEYDDKGKSGKTGRTIKYYVVPSGGKTGGEFDPAVLLKTIGKDLFFATEKGVLCKFNFDKRDPVTGLIPNEYYDFNGRAIFSGCATKMDNCGIPHLTKTTVKRSTVIKTRTFEASGIKVKVRTNRKAFNQVARIINGQATFDDPSFEDYSFTTSDKSIFSINEREKKWVEKQIFLYSDEFHRPFAIHYLAYRYVIAGRYKE